MIGGRKYEIQYKPLADYAAIYMLPESHRLWTVYCMLLKHLEEDSTKMPQVTYISPVMQKYYIILKFLKMNLKENQESHSGW